MIRKRSKGLSLLETTVALYTLVAALLVVAALFHTGMQAGADTDKRRMATAALQSAHAFASDLNSQDLGARYGFDEIRNNWIPSHTEPVPNFPDFTATYTVTEVPAYSPCTSLELRYPDPNQRLTLGVKLQVELRVGGLDQELESSFTLSDPPRELELPTPVGISRTSGQTPLPIYDPVARNPNQVYQAVLRDENGQAIEGATFNWGIVPVTGNGSIFWDLDLLNRRGNEARLFNFVVTEFGDISYRPGTLNLDCRSQYRGIEYIGVENSIVMEPPP